jgi:outer membrane protein TolC
MGHAAPSFLGIRNLAAVERIPRHHFGRTTGKIIRQTTQTSEVAAVLLAAMVVGLLSGCKSASPIVWPKPVATAAVVGSPSPAAQPNSEIGLASFQESQADSAPAVPPRDDSDKVTGVSPPAPDAFSEPAASSLAVGVLSLGQVLGSVQVCYPEIEVAIGEIEAAEGKILSSWGQFDSAFEAFSLSQPLGFYKNYRNGVGVGQPLWGGGEVYGTYRIGRGNFEPWYGERVTDKGGEFKAGFSLPLLKDRAIDARRAGVQSAEAGRDEVRSDVESRLLQFQRFATQAYWDWVAAGQAVAIQQRLLELAQQRVQQINERVEKGDLAKIAQIDNERFIAKRMNDLIKTRRTLEKAAIKLSLFLRDETCTPVIAGSDRLPDGVPEAQRVSVEQLQADAATAIAIRPELQALSAARRQACIDLQYANNLTLPKLDVKGYAAKDVGELASSLGDKRPFQLELGAVAEVPIQRREGLGKIRTAEAKLVQIDAKSRFVTDKIRAEIQDAASAVNAAFDQIQQSEKNVALARQSLQLGRQLFNAGDIDLIELNIYENSVADAELELLEANLKYLFYLAIYETATSGQAFAP